MSLICVTWHSHKSTPAGEFIIPINAEGYGFNLIALSWLRWRLILYAAQTLFVFPKWVSSMNHLDFKLRYEAPFSRLFAAVRWWSVAQIFDFIRCDFVADHLSLSTVTALNTRWHGRHLTWMWIQPSGDYEQESLDCWQRAPAPFFSPNK